MRRHAWIAALAGTLAARVVAAAAAGAIGVPAVIGPPAGELAPLPEQPTAEQIIERNVAARGGADAWRRIQTMVWAGHMESADPNLPRLGFLLEQKRPNKTRFEVASLAQRTLRIFDGAHGWKARPNRDGSLDIRPYTAQELTFARQAPGLDGPLIDHLDKGILVDFAGTESVDGRSAYRLHVRLPAGEQQDLWIDAESFLEIRYDRTSYTANGSPSVVRVAFRDYQTVEGLKVPGTLEIGAGPAGADSGRVPDRMVIERIALNAPLDDKTFDRPGGGRRPRMATVEITPPPMDPRQAFGPSSAPPTR